MYTLKKVFTFETVSQASSFGEVVHVFGKVRLFERTVIFEAGLAFSLWRKLSKLASLVRHHLGSADSIDTLVKRVGLEASTGTAHQQ